MGDVRIVLGSKFGKSIFSSSLSIVTPSPLFGFQNIFPESKPDDEFIRVEDTYSELLQNDNENNKIEQHLSKETTDAILNIIKNK